MASLTMTKVRECPDCGHVHDCAWYIEMALLVQKLSKEVDRLVEYIKDCDKAGLSTPEIHPLEDK